MIDRTFKRSIGQMMKGVQVVGAADGDRAHLYCSHWVCQVSFEEPIIMASVSRRHDTEPLIAATRRFSVSILAGDQVAEGQYFSYPGRRFRNLATEYVEDWDGLPIVPNSIAWLRCDVIEVIETIGGDDLDHRLYFARVSAVREGRLREPPLLYSSRLGWRISGDKAREPGDSIRDRLLERLAASGLSDPGEPEADDA